MTRREKAEQRRIRAVQARLLLAARPEDCARVSQLLGGSQLMAAYQLLDHGGDIKECIKWLEDAIARLANQMLYEAKQITPVDTGALHEQLGLPGLGADK